MIRYHLQCDNDHDFESWFQNSEAFDKLAKRKQVACPECGSTKVSKAIMAPNVGVKGNKKSSVPATATPDRAPATADPEVAEAREQVMAAMRHLRSVVEQNAEYVGPRFAEEARKIHYKESEEKGIYGEASVQEVKELVDEGIDCHPLPVLPEDQN